MHPNRRRKKRPNYGIRTVEVMRGPNGFGFTISGQQPCILSCIVSNSPADQAGLRAGDFLISVNGVSVSKITHDAVVNLIGNSIGPIRMTIAENYYSDSSDEDVDLGRAVNSRKPKYMHKPRMQRNYKHSGGSSNNNSNNNRMLLDGSNKKGNEASGVSPSSYMSSSIPMEEEGGPIEYKAIVGYLGTIEMPKQLLPNSRLQTVCSCIRKLRQEKRSPTAVLMTVLPTCLTLKNSSNHILAIYPTNRVVYISSTVDKDSRYFGLVTSAVCDMRSTENVLKRCENSYVNVWEVGGEKKCSNLDLTVSNSCHVFVTDPKIVDHSLHLKKAESFKVTCTTDVVTGNCLEFPRNALYIVSLVQNMYRLQNSESENIYKHGVNEEVVANSPQPSASSNSDSGIGFRDDCGNISDRILVVEFPSHRPLPVISNNHKRPVNIAASSITFESLDMPLNNSEHVLNNVRCFDFKLAANNLNESVCDDSKHLSNLNNVRACENICIKNAVDTKQNGDVDYVHQEELTNRLTVRAMPNPRNLKARDSSPHSCEDHQERAVDVPEYSPGKKSYETVSLHSMGDDMVDYKSSVDNVSMHSSKSFELSNLKAIFKTPSTKLFENKKSTKRQLKMVSSCDNLISDKYEASVLKYKLSPKVYGLAKPNRSCEELNTAFDGEKFGGFGSLQDLCSWIGRGEKPAIAQSEPDVRGCKNSSSDLGERLTLALASSVFNRVLQASPLEEDIAPQVEKEFRQKEGGNIGGGLLISLRPPFKRVNSFRRANSGRRPNSILAPPDVVPQCYESAEQKPPTGENPVSWATSFEKLLECPVGLHAFASFLKKEFSAENIYFWTACERFKRLPPCAEKTAEAQRIYQRHLCVGAVEAINVDSRAQQCTEHFLQEPNDAMFDLAQKQIFNLMKFDSYPRFLKSDLYKQCMSGNVDGPELDSGLLIQPTSATPTKLKKSLSNAEDRRRKSLLPWHRKNRSKSKDRGESEYNQRQSDPTSNNDVRSQVSDVHSSRSSLTSLDLAISSNQQDQLKNSSHQVEEVTNMSRGPLCRVILSNDSTTVVQIRQSETIEHLVSRLLDKRGLTYTTYDVHTDKHPKPLDIRESSMNLAGCEVTVEERVCFKLDLPNRKIISVKSKSSKMLASVLRQVLSRYDFNLDEVIVSAAGGNSEPMDVNVPVTAVVNSRLQVQKVRRDSSHSKSGAPLIKVTKLPPPSLDEITNRVYEDILQEKADSALLKPKSSDKGSVKSDDWGSEHSSGLFGRFMRKDSAGVHDRKKKLPTRGKGHSTNSSVEDVNAEHGGAAAMKKPLIAKWKPGVKLQMACSESDELYEGLSRAQRSRLEDQRGTEINFELPDFLKDKENHQSNGGRKAKEDATSRFYTADCASFKLETAAHSNYENRSVMASENNLNNQQAKVNNPRIHLPNKFHHVGSEKEGIKNNCPDGGASIENIGKSNESLNSVKGGDPPPLPPKPKIVPSRPSNWGQNAFFKNHQQRDSSPRKDATKQGLCLEQSTSSFV